MFPMLNGKKGICYTLREPGNKKGGTYEENIPKILMMNPMWYYCWGDGGTFPKGLIPDTIDFLPMIWGYYPKSFPGSLSRVEQQHPRFLLAFNEPDGKKQSNVSVEKAIAAWPEMEALGIPLVSPSCVHADKKWMTDFMEQAEEKGLRVDAIGVHSYGGVGAKALKNKLERVHEAYRRPVLITEFAVADWKAKETSENCHKPEDVMKFMQEMLPWLEAQEWIIGYSWFPFGYDSAPGCCSALLDADDNLTELGKYYAEFAPPSCPVSGN